MATKQVSLVHVDEDYIDIELSSSPNLFSYSIGSPPSTTTTQNREFEFQNKKESTTSPADELFYKGKLLPLHLPPRLQMVQKLLQNADSTFGYVRSHSSLEDSSFPYTTNANTPLESCNISPSQSHRVSSSDPYPSEYLFDWNTEIELFPKKPCSKKLKHNPKQFWLSQRLKASRAYLKSLFGKSGCSDKCCASSATTKVGAMKKSKCKECQNRYVKDGTRKNNSFQIFDDNIMHKRTCAVKKSINNDMLEDGFNINNTRRSFSGVIQRHYASKASPLSSSSSASSSSSSSFSLSSAGSYDLQLFKKGFSANSELQSSIESAIAHCKQSQQQSSASNKICSQSALCGNEDIGRTFFNQSGSGRVDKTLLEKNEFFG
ncbi:hypothetical protein VNO77_17552 [Canavalia gladiata]|uniref:Membrane-associated kinase regulator 4 n=1 Tax=Canavalia gladiata TaxID=3824 RepID=A0AAN9QJG7_CANGL